MPVPAKPRRAVKHGTISCCYLVSTILSPLGLSIQKKKKTEKGSVGCVVVLNGCQ